MSKLKFTTPKQNNNDEKKFTKEHITKLFNDTKDVIIKDIVTSNGEISYTIFYCTGLCDMERIDKEIIPELEKVLFNKSSRQLKKEQLPLLFPKSTLEECSSNEDCIKKVFTGQLGIYIKDRNETTYFVDLAKLPKRDPDEPNTEISIRGPKDGFIEDIETNIALIRKRLKTNSLIYEQFEIGKRTHTKVGLFYIYDITKKETIDEVRERLKDIDIDGLHNANQLEELLIRKKFFLFPIFQYTGRPDFAVDALLRGRFVIIIDGAPSVIIAPVTLTFLLKTAEDAENYFCYSSLERLLRILGLIVALLLPGFWVALLSFHQNQIPFTLLASIAQVRQGVPIPTNVEAVTMLLIFQLFQEAGSRLPSAIGQILSVVGGLIIGDAAIRAGLTSPGMVVIIAIAAVATFSLVNQSLATAISVLRIYVLICSTLLGIYGFFISTFSILLYLSNIRTFGIPYLSPISPISRDIWNAIIRPSWKLNDLRSSTLSNRDLDKQGDNE